MAAGSGDSDADCSGISGALIPEILAVLSRPVRLADSLHQSAREGMIDTPTGTRFGFFDEPVTVRSRWHSPASPEQAVGAGYIADFLADAVTTPTSIGRESGATAISPPC
jgi:hypothetical protein